MKTIEIRRHSIRNKAGQHLTQQGVSLARQVGETTGPFHRVITSTVPRAFETAIAMGFAVDEESELISTTGPYVDTEAPWPMSPGEYARIVRQGKAAARYADQLAEFYNQFLDRLAEGESALVINHGGVVELGAIACLPDANHDGWGTHFGYCEGVRLFREDGKFMKVEILRV